MSPLTTAKHVLKASELPIESVTVFRSSNAQIVRVLNLDLNAGSNIIEITGISSSIDTESLRVSGLGDARLADVVCVVDNSVSQKKDQIGESRAIQDAKAKIRDLKLQKEARLGEVDILFKYGQALGGTSILPEAVTSFAENAVSKKLEVGRLVQKLDDEVVELERFIETTQQFTVGDAKGKATITVVAHEDGEIQLTVSYLVDDVQWTPTYDLHARSEGGTPSPSVLLHYRVHLSQTTGEHWNGTSLILSTTDTDSLSNGIPEPPLLSINSSSQTQTTQTASKSLGRGGAARHRRIMVHEEAAFVSKNPISVTYTVEGKSNIPSDGESHKVSVAQLPFEAAISHVIVARKEALAYLQCEVKNTTDYHLLPGPVSVFMDDGYVSKTSIPDINTGDMFRCTLGVDASTRVTHKLTSASETSKASSFVEQYKTTTYVSTTTINNRHADNYPISVIEKSSVPVAPQGDTRIRVFLKKPEGLAESEDAVELDLNRSDGFKAKWTSGMDENRGEGGKAEGKFVWLGTVAPGKEVTLVSEWEVKAPAEVDWFESSS